MEQIKINPRSLIHKSVFYLMIIALLSGGMYSCKSKKKLAREEAAAAEARKIAKAKADLEAIITDDAMPLEEKEETLSHIKSLNIQDEEVKALIARAEEVVKREREELLAKERAERLAREREERRKSESGENRSLDQYFAAIADASSDAEADRLISGAMQQFANENVPVLIIISEYGGEKDYDRPTTIGKYLNYLKDQNKNLNKVENVVFDANGKIKELELKRK